MKVKNDAAKESSSFRDPSGFVYYSNNSVYRQVNYCYQQDYQFFVNSGLKQKLTDSNLVLDFTVAQPVDKQTAFIILKTNKIPFISYPYEWSFHQLKDAALLTLHIQKTALLHNMSLKDASAYNVQFYRGRPIFIDLLSFERYQEGQPWVAYQQFCQHLLGPLLLMSMTDIRLNILLKSFLDGIPLNLTSRLLPKKTYFNPSILSHIHWHAGNQKKYATKYNQSPAKNKKLPKNFLLGIIDNLEKLIKPLQSNLGKTEWGEYYSITNYSKPAFISKKRIVDHYIKLMRPSTVWDVGGNTGEFSRLASSKKINTISFDLDPLAVDLNYQKVKKNREQFHLPLVMDFTNPSPSLGWNLQERRSLIDRGPADMVVALAIIHHFCLSHNLPFAYLASFWQKIGQTLVVEFVPKEDSQAQKLLARKPDIFPWYNQAQFEKVFLQFFTIVEKASIKHGSLRTVYLMKTKL